MPDPNSATTTPEPKGKGEMEEAFLEQKRTCPYCSKVIETRPYWSHISSEHPAEYENSQGTWLPLYKDYIVAGMEISTILLVMSELFNQPIKDIEAFLVHSLYKEKIAAGTGEEAAIDEVAKALDKSPAAIRKLVK
ncbi:MAG: hypothetical protein Q6373_007375 [Candidatus Sigynarchaeota archaeon]